MPEMFTGNSGGGVARTAGAVGGTSSLSVAVTPSASANTKGSWVQLIAATEFDANWIDIDLSSMGAGINYLVDIGIGASTEQVIIPDLYAGNRQNADYPAFLFPIFIPKGSRLVARCQCSSAGAFSVGVSIRLIAGVLFGGGSGPSFVSAYGAVASSVGTNVDPGGTAHTDSAWTEITASTNRDHNWLLISGKFGDGALAAVTRWRGSVGIGRATEQVLIPDIHFSGDTTIGAAISTVRSFPVFIPRGSRLTWRHRCSVTTDGDRDANIKFYGAG